MQPLYGADLETLFTLEFQRVFWLNNSNGFTVNIRQFIVESF